MRDFKRLQVPRFISSSLKHLLKVIWWNSISLDFWSTIWRMFYWNLLLSIYRKQIWRFPFQEDPPAGVSGAPGENNIMLWNAVIFGPHETPFEVGKLQSHQNVSNMCWRFSWKGPPLLFKIYFQDGTFKLTLEFSEEYPNKPPVVKFLSKVNKIVQKKFQNSFTLMFSSDVPSKHLRRWRHLSRHPPGFITFSGI